MKNQVTTNNDSGRRRCKERGIVSSPPGVISVQTQSHETATYTNVIYIIILSFIDHIDIL